MRRAQRRFRTGVAIGASLALHLVLLAWFLRLASIEPAPPRGPAFVELLEVPPPAPAPAARREASPPEPAREPEAAPRPPAARATPAPDPGPAAPARRAPPSGSPEEIRRWFESQGLGGDGARAGREAGPGRDDGTLAIPVPRDTQRALRDGAPGSGGAGERAARLSAELHAADVSRYPDRRWTALRDRLGQGFAPGPDLVGGGAQAGAGQSFLRSYGAAAQRYARTGSPYPDAPDAPGRIDPRAMAAAEAADVTARNPHASGSGFEGRGMLASGATAREEVFPGRTAVVAMEQDPRGAVVGVWLVRSSGSEAYDALAMRQVEGLRRGALPAPFGAAITEWAFRAEVVVTPFRPGAGGTFDLGFEGVDLERPLEARVRVRPPELVAIRQLGPG